MINWLRHGIADVRSNGIDGLRRMQYDLRRDVAQRTLPRLLGTEGTSIYEREWDVLVILDGCRLDLMESVADEYAFAVDPAAFRSGGSNSKEWMRANFTDEWASEMRRTAMVTGNPYSSSVLDPNDFALLDEVWRYVWDDDLQTIRARPITERAVAVGRERSPERMIVHYMQPHASFVPVPELQPGEDERSIWRAIHRGRVDRDEVWRAYRENLEYVLDEVDVLLENLDADRVVVSSDHGQAVGEFGIYGHPSIPLECLRTVPWIETTATDERTIEPAVERHGGADPDVDQRLADLGYIEAERGEG